MTARLFHVRHSCGHSVYWESDAFGMLASGYPCPWCGGETGEAKYDRPGILEASNGERVYADSDYRGEGDSAVVTIFHTTGDVCCLCPAPPHEGRAKTGM